MKTNIAIASDLSGFPLKKELCTALAEREDIEIVDFGIPGEDQPRPYYEQAPKVAEAVQSGTADKGILICGTGQGMAIAANKYKGIYACVVDDLFSAERARIINNANIITMGGWITAPFAAKEIAAAWLSVSFTQKMELKKDFLTRAFHEVQNIEERNFK